MHQDSIDIKIGPQLGELISSLSDFCVARNDIIFLKKPDSVYAATDTLQPDLHNIPTLKPQRWLSPHTDTWRPSTC